MRETRARPQLSQMVGVGKGWAENGLMCSREYLSCALRMISATFLIGQETWQRLHWQQSFTQSSTERSPSIRNLMRPVGLLGRFPTL